MTQTSATSGDSIPVAVSVFPDELYPAPRSWAERAYPKLIHYNKLDKGDSWLTKPVRPALLLDSLHKLFSKSDRGNGDFVRPVTVRIPQHGWRKDIRVLVVEDNFTNQTLIKEQLGVLGYTSQIVDDAPRALEILTQERYDIVLSGRFCSRAGYSPISRLSRTAVSTPRIPPPSQDSIRNLATRIYLPPRLFFGVGLTVRSCGRDRCKLENLAVQSATI